MCVGGGGECTSSVCIEKLSVFSCLPVLQATL